MVATRALSRASDDAWINETSLRRPAKIQAVIQLHQYVFVIAVVQLEAREGRPVKAHLRRPVHLRKAHIAKHDELTGEKIPERRDALLIDSTDFRALPGRQDQPKQPALIITPVDTLP